MLTKNILPLSIFIFLSIPAAHAAEVCNDKYCLIYEVGSLAKLSANATVDITSEAGIQPDETLSAIVWTGRYWLISVTNWDGSPSRYLWIKYTSKILKYDGSNFTDLSALAELNKTKVYGVSPKVISRIVCGEEYCLIGYWIPAHGAQGGVLKYEGESFSEISAKGGEPKEMFWNGEYWLIWYVQGEFRSSNLEKFDGARSVVIPLFDLRQNEHYWISNISWNAAAKHWLISAEVGIPGAWSPAGKSELRQESVIYDGRKVSSLSAQPPLRLFLLSQEKFRQIIKTLHLSWWRFC